MLRVNGYMPVICFKIPGGCLGELWNLLVGIYGDNLVASSVLFVSFSDIFYLAKG